MGNGYRELIPSLGGIVLAGVQVAAELAAGRLSRTAAGMMSDQAVSKHVDEAASLHLFPSRHAP